MKQKKKHLVIVGGGITGLSAAWEVQKLANGQIETTLIEAQAHLGGKMLTRYISHPEGDFIIDAGPESFVTRKPEAWQLAQELGLSGQIINPGSETRNMYVLDGGAPKKIPLSPPAFLTSDLLSLRGKLRMALEPFIPARRDDGDESLAEFVTRRLGEEALEKMLGPVLAGIYNTDPKTQSIMTTSPVMREMEKEHGGLIKGALARMRARKNDASDTPRPPQFITFKNGAQVMVDALENQLQARIMKNTQALIIRQEGSQHLIETSGGETLTADSVILASPSNQAGKLLSQAAPDASALLGQIAHENIGTATLIFNSQDISLPYTINGLMVPRREQRKIDAITWTTNKPMPRAPQGYEMIRVFFGGGDPALVNQPQEKILETILSELKNILNIEAAPVDTAVFCWPDEFPQAYVGHLDLVDEIDASLPPGLWAAGSSYRGIGVPDCIRQGRQAAKKAIKYLNE